MNEHEELWANMYQQRTARVGHRNIWLYLIQTAIGNIGVVQWEDDGQMIHEKLFRESYDKAERCFEQTVSKIALGKM